jgi:hypothetical protein
MAPSEGFRCQLESWADSLIEKQLSGYPYTNPGICGGGFFNRDVLAWAAIHNGGRNRIPPGINFNQKSKIPNHKSLTQTDSTPKVFYLKLKPQRCN